LTLEKPYGPRRLKVGTLEVGRLEVCGAARVDDRALQALRQAAPLRFRVAETAAEVEAIHRLRFRTVIERGWGSVEDFPDGQERDTYDRRSVHIGGWNGEVVVAAARMVLPEAGARMPTEEAFDLSLGNYGRLVDIGRLCVAPAYRDIKGRVLLGLLGRIWLEMRSRGFATACGILTPFIARMYRRWDLEAIPLGVSRCYWEAERFPALVVPAGDEG
jgi:predicted GNAT family N-acyltransferase